MRRLLGLAAFLVVASAIVGAVVYANHHHVAQLFSADRDCSATVGGRTVTLDRQQSRNATLITAISIRRGLPAHAATIALATAYQESKLYNLTSGDRDSIGLFQQRPSQGWGRPAQLRNPTYAANAFYDALQKIDGYQTLRVTVAAQRVQRSGFPEAYAAHEADARVLASSLTGYSPAAFGCAVDAASGQPAPAARRADGVRRALGAAFGPTSVRVARGQVLRIPVGSSERGWAVAAYLAVRADALQVGSVSYAGHTWSTGGDRSWRRGHGPAHTVVVR
ncbi:MAG: hypothetical protein ACR2K3_02410 [Nocardioides sp.]